MSRNSYLGRHRAAHISISDRVARGGAVAVTAAVASLGVLAGPAAASPGHNWNGVARCESSGNWHINTGNGFYGGLQFTAATWLGYGGGAYAPRADLAGAAAQIAIAERVLVGQGIGAWPVCGRYLDVGSVVADTRANVRPAARPLVTPQPVTPQPVTPQPVSVDRDGDDAGARAAAGEGRYVVRSGDTLELIAVRHHVVGGWATLAHLNRDVIENPNLIYPGQHITL